MKTTSLGQNAETFVAKQLRHRGFKVLERNWKTKVCEIDIVVQKDGIIYFVEVKYRSSSAQGDGLDYVGPQKLRRMHFAAAIWCQTKNWDGDYRLLACSVSGVEQKLKVERIIEV